MPERQRRIDWVPIAIAGAALALRLASLALTRGTALAGDEREYFVLATQLAQGDAPSPMGDRPPLVPALFGAVLAASGASLFAVRVCNAVAGALLVFPVHALGRAAGGVRTARVAAVIAAAYPSFVATSHGLWSEPVYMLAALAALAVLARDDRLGGRASLARVGLAGALFGAAALAREVGVAVPIVVAGWLAACAGDARRRVVRPAVLAAAFALVVLPWTAYVNGVASYGADPGGFDAGAAPFALLSRTTWQNLYVGNASPRTIVDRKGRERTVTPKRHYYTLGQTRRETEAAARLLALEAIAERMPAWPFEKVASEVPKLFAPTSIAQHRLLAPSRDGANEWTYRLRVAALDGPLGRRAAALAIAAVYALVAIAGAGGLAAIRDARLAALLWLFVAAHVLPSVAAFGGSRFRLPLMGALVVGAGYAFARPDALRDLSGARRAIVVVAAAAVAALVGAQWGAALSRTWG